MIKPEKQYTVLYDSMKNHRKVTTNISATREKTYQNYKEVLL